MGRPVDDTVSPCSSPTTECVMCQPSHLLPMLETGPLFSASPMAVSSKNRASICSDSSFSSLTSDDSADSLTSGSSCGCDAPERNASAASAPSPRSILKRKSCSTRAKRSLKFHPSVLLWTAVQQGKFGELRQLLEDTDKTESEELDVNRANHQGITPLHLCCFSGATECAKLLIEHGAFPNQPDKDEWTPVHAAAVSGHHRILRLLSEFGADLQHEDAFGRAPAEITENQVTKSVLAELLVARSTKTRCTAL